jgi:hypothetical protein
MFLPSGLCKRKHSGGIQELHFSSDGCIGLNKSLQIYMCAAFMNMRSLQQGNPFLPILAMHVKIFTTVNFVTRRADSFYTVKFCRL